MRMIAFTKMHGAGNDFVMIDGTVLGDDTVSAERIAALCDRRKGVGADGLIVLHPEGGPYADFRMTYYNADGGEAEMCGNGARCSVAFADSLGWTGTECRFATHSGILEGRVIERDGVGAEVEVSMPRWKDLAVDRTVEGSDWPEHHACNTGVPHLILPVEDVGIVDVASEGRKLRFHETFEPAGTNVNWVAASDERTPDGRPIHAIRTYERGVEDETLACGTGASAAAVVLCRLGRAESPVALRTRGGDLLRVTVDIEAGNLLLRGPAVTSFEGEVACDE